MREKLISVWITKLLRQGYKIYRIDESECLTRDDAISYMKERVEKTNCIIPPAIRCDENKEYRFLP